MHYEDEADQRFEASQIRAENEEQKLRADAGCTDDCPPDCDCVPNMLAAKQELDELNADYFTSQGSP